MGTDTASRLVYHPQLGYWFVNLEAHWSQRSKVSLMRYKHVLEDSLAVDTH